MVFHIDFYRVMQVIYVVLLTIAQKMYLGLASSPQNASFVAIHFGIPFIPKGICA